MANYVIKKDYNAEHYANYAFFSGAVSCMFYQVSEEDNHFYAIQMTIRT